MANIEVVHWVVYRGIFWTKGPIYCRLDSNDLKLLLNSRSLLCRELAKAEPNQDAVDGHVGAMRIAARNIYIAAFGRKPPFYFYPGRIMVSANAPPTKNRPLRHALIRLLHQPHPAHSSMVMSAPPPGGASPFI